jgi:predicted DCC family thiol-disulfide oxidoreductase YuxK
MTAENTTLDRSRATIFYDGGCGLCHRFVRFALAKDREGKYFRFAPLEGNAFAVLEIGKILGGVWRAVAVAASVIPLRLLDAGYDGIARIRHRIFATPPDACPILSTQLRDRFDLD